MAYIGLECANIPQLASCGHEKLQRMGLDVDKIESKFKETFLASGDNTQLKADSLLLQDAGINRYPAVTLNGIKMKATLNVRLPSPRPSSFSTTSATP